MSEPRDTASWINARTSRFVNDVPPGFRTYEMIFHDVCGPVHTFQLNPSRCAVPVCEPKGWTPPRLFSQIIGSVP